MTLTLAESKSVRAAVPGDPPVRVLAAHRWSDGAHMGAVHLRCGSCGHQVLQLVPPNSQSRFGDPLRDPCPLCGESP